MGTHRTPHINIDVESFRIKAGMSVLQLSDKTGIARTTLRRKLAQPGLFTLNELAAIIAALNIPADAFAVAS